ncbi:MAG: Npun_R2821/Npun_R2822 family protein [Leptolyngbyaceae cyanobacterium]
MTQPTQPTRGIYILGNDVVFDQVVALLNSIAANVSTQIPILICPYDDQMDRIRAEISQRPNVDIFDDQEAIARWDDYSAQIWHMHPKAQRDWQTENGFKLHRFGCHRRFPGLDGPFEHFVYLDADTLVLSSLDNLFEQLHQHPWVVYDFQHRDPTHVFDVNSPELGKHFSPESIEQNIFCSGMYASHSGIFDAEDCDRFLQSLAAGEIDMLYHMAPDQTILNYMVMRSKTPVYNLAHELPPEQVTGCCVTSPHFEPNGHTLCDRGTPLTYLHYIGISSKVFARLCAGENLDIPYRELFLHYRYLHAPDQRPTFTGKAKPYNPPPTFRTKLFRKLGFAKIS